ncbi:N-acetylmuramoyl-L-alanine amidase [Sphingobacterium sp. lm-10]|uniref:N-acetylmuramoyl-L-alanine amidase family protein n=1 Tax=Sphingobacterium sp. lm-10 TaxID=2944904 RepID=UPI00202104B8|nr:N-acetylmuramoyl-L-alanine amidase [Sphingobacterium sp. lm-10]MCL7987947.1 N-acetylmuramoyl-L-alanine amidase [Sphingobacterium sp. lm-10]
MSLLKNVKSSTGLIFLSCILCAGLFYANANPSENDDNYAADNEVNKPFSLIVIDPGHGGDKPGARGRISAEKDVVLQVSKKLKESIEKEMPGVKVLLTRESDVDVPFYERTALANNNHADLFLSVHCNSADSERRVKGRNGRYTTQVTRRPNVRGTETFVCGYNRLGQQDVAIRENADILLEDNYKENYNGFDPNDPSSYIVFSLMKRKYRDQSIKVATMMQEEYVQSGRGNRGVQELSLAVLATAGMPAVLTEIGFISSPDEENFMLSPAGQTEIVSNLTTAIKRFKTSVER